jgi:uncharacterized protein
MKLHRERADINLITACGDGFVAVGEARFSRSVVVFPARIISAWPPAAVAELSAGHFAPIWEENPEVVIVGCGRAFAPAQGEWLREFVRRGVGIETMDTPAACRTYNILAADGRQAAAALII